MIAPLSDLAVAFCVAGVRLCDAERAKGKRDWRLLGSFGGADDLFDAMGLCVLGDGTCERTLAELGAVVFESEDGMLHHGALSWDSDSDGTFVVLADAAWTIARKAGDSR